LRGGLLSNRRGVDGCLSISLESGSIRKATSVVHWADQSFVPDLVSELPD
jgi:hypothetical protein